MLLSYLLLFQVFLLQCIQCFETSNPVWKTSIYFRAGQQNVINTLTGNNKTPQYTFVFSSALTGVPNIAYGIAKYQGIDTLVDECFQIFRIGLTSTSFSVAVQITGSTSLYILRVPYLAIEPTFPHHLNTFDNIPVNYSAGPLVNITSRSTTERTYLNTINYTQQSADRKYTNFTLPTTRYKIVLMMTSLFVATSYESNASQNFSMDLRLETTILSETTYSILVRLVVKVIVNRLHFSQIVYDPVDIESSYKYKLLYEMWTVDNLGGDKTIPQEFQDNFIMGLTQFTTKLGYCGFDYMWDWKQNDTFFGVKIYESITRAKLCAFIRIASSVVYVQTWQCLAPYFYYNHTSFMCQDQCGMYTYPAQKINDIEIDYLCLPCDWACSVCNSSKKCISCNSDDMRLFNGTCYCPHGYLDTLLVTKCQKCLDLHCLICQKNANYKTNPLPTDPITTSMVNLCIMCEQGYVINETTRSCDEIAKCDQTKNQLLNYDTNQCEICQVEGCTQCRQSMQLKFNGTVTDVMQVGMSKRVLTSSSPFGVVSCVLCDESNQFFKNFTTKACEKCSLSQCINCSSLYTCLNCNSLNQYFLNSTTRLCQKCVVQGCISCYNLTACRVCDSVKGYFLINETKTCKYCGLGCGQCLINSTGTQVTSSCKSCSNGLVFRDGKCACNKGTELSKLGYFVEIVNSTTITCSSCDPLCKQCQNSSISCTACYFQHNRILSKQSSTCNCSTNYTESVQSLICSKANPSLPDMGYAISPSTGQVSQICGDGIRLVLECDDGNLINTDGCSSNCSIEKDFICQTPLYDISTCQYTGNISVTDYNLTKDPFDNVFDLSLQLYPLLVMYQALDWKDGLYFGGNPQMIIMEAIMKSEDKLFLKIKYFQNIKNLNITLGFSSSSKSSQVRFLQQSLTFHFVETSLDFSETTNNLEIAFYPQTTYSTIKLFQTVFTIIMVVYVGLVFGSVFFFKRIVPVMVMLVCVQLCFISLSSIQNFQPQTFSIINNFNQVFGINSIQKIINQCPDSQLRTESFMNLKFQKCFASNLNLMIIFELVAIVGIISMALIQFRWESVGKKYGDYFKRSLSNIVFFNLSNFVISAALIDYDLNHKIDMGLAGFQGLLTILHFVLIVKYRKIYLIQVEIEDYEEEIKKEEIMSQSQKRSKVQIQSISSDALSQESSSKHEQQNQESAVERDVSNAQKPSESKVEISQQQQTTNNKQIIYFQAFIILISICCPTTYLFFCQKYPLICSISILGVIILLFVIQFAINPFNLTLEQKSPLNPFPMLSRNFYITYGLTLLFLVSNLLFTTLEGSFGNDFDRRMQVMSYLSYGQVTLFLVMIGYMIVAWGYAAYLSFFDQDILLRYYKDSQKQQHQDQMQSDSSEIQPRQSLPFSQLSLSNDLPQHYNRNASSKLSKQNYTTTYSNQFTVTPKQQRRIIPTIQDSENLIFQMEEDSVMEDRF